MAVFPQKPRSGQKVLQGLYNSVCQIIDYLPTLEVRGDNSSTSVTKTSNGTIVHASNNNDQLSQNKRYFGIHGVKIKNNKYIFATLTGGTYIDVKYEDFNEQNEQYELPNPTINCTLSAGRYIQITPEGVINYTGPSGGGTTIVDNFGVPNLSALNFNNEPLANDGNGLTWLIPVSAGQQFTYSTGASGNVNASYAPAKGKSGSSFAITRDVLSTIPADGYIRITAFDDGLHHNQCLRVFDGTTNWNEGLPLYKFSNWSSAVIPSGGRYTTVQTTSTRLNSQEQEEIYTLPNPIINNMLSGGKYITIQETDEYDVKLQYPLINCTLHGDLSTVTIDADGTIHSIGGGGGTVIASGVGYPDHSKLFPDNYPAMSGLGISWLIPVSAGVEYRFYTDATGGEDEEENTIQVAYGKFAPSVGETGTVSSLTNGNDFIPDSNGWVRISVFDDGRNEGSCLRFYVNDEDGQYATPLYRFHGFTNYTAGSGIAINSGIISCMIQPGQGLMSTALYDGNSNPYDPNRPITGIAFDLSTQFLNDLSTIYYGRNAVDKVLSSQNGNLVWATNVEPGGGGETYYADETTIKLSSTNNTFYLYDVEPALTGEGDIQIGNYGSDGVRRITSISATPYTGTDGIGVQNHVISLTATIPTKTSDLINDNHFITINDVPPGSVYQGDNVTIAASGTNNNIFYVIDGVFARLSTVTNLSTELSGHIDYVSSNIPLSTSQLVNDVPFVTSTWVDDNFISGGSTGDHMYYNSQEKLLKCMLTGGTNIEIEDIGNYGYINCTLTGLDQLANTPGFITSPGPTPTAYYADNDTLSTTDNGTKFYVRNVSSLLTGEGGTTVYYYGTGLNNTIIAGISSLNYQGGNGIQITPVEGQGGVATTYASIGLSTQFYNDLTAISTRPATGDKILSSHNGTLSWETNTAGSNIPTPTANKVLSSNASNQIVWATNTGGSTPTPGGQSVNYIFSSGIYQATAGSKWIVRYPHIPLAWSEDEEDAPWPEGWQPPKEQGSDEYISQQWPLYQYYYNQPAEPQLPCGYLCSLYSWAEGNYGYMKGQWDILLKLPSVNERTIVEVINYTDTALAVVTDNGKQIIPQSFENSVGDSQHAYAIQYSNNLYSFKHGSYNGCCKIVFYYDPAPPYTPERTPYTPAIMEQLTSGGCWFAQIFTD